MSEMQSHNSRVTVPCRGCADRRVGCHGECDRYREFKSRLSELNEQKAQETKSNAEYADYVIKVDNKRKKKIGRGRK